MSETACIAHECAHMTDGDIAVRNLQSARRRSWSRFWDDPLRPGIAEAVVELEALTAQFAGDLTAFDRLEVLSTLLARADETAQSLLVLAQVASMTHRFADARRHLAQATRCGAAPADMRRLTLSIDQACGTALDDVLAARRHIAAKSRRLEDMLPLAALLAERGAFAEADRTYREALDEYHDVSPFGPAWVAFQLGFLWGEQVPEPQTARAAEWYARAIDYVPGYTKARVHLAEIYLARGEASEAEALLMPALPSGDPEVAWRLADAAKARGCTDRAQRLTETAHAGFEHLLAKHGVAFADHAAAFYCGSGSDLRRALQLARINAANRPTVRAFEQTYLIAVQAGEMELASEFRTFADSAAGARAASMVPGQSGSDIVRSETR